MSWLFRAVVVLGLAPGLTVSAAESDAKSGEWRQWRGPGRENKAADTDPLQTWEGAPPKLLWMSDGLGEGYASVSIADGRIYTTGNTSDGQAVVALDANGGKVLWTKSLTEEPPKHGHEGSRCT